MVLFKHKKDFNVCRRPPSLARLLACLPACLLYGWRMWRMWVGDKEDGGRMWGMWRMWRMWVEDGRCG